MIQCKCLFVLLLLSNFRGAASEARGCCNNDNILSCISRQHLCDITRVFTLSDRCHSNKSALPPWLCDRLQTKVHHVLDFCVCCCCCHEASQTNTTTLWWVTGSAGTSTWCWWWLPWWPDDTFASCDWYYCHSCCFYCENNSNFVCTVTQTKQ